MTSRVRKCRPIWHIHRWSGLAEPLMVVNICLIDEKLKLVVGVHECWNVIVAVGWSDPLALARA